jgi:hypothetical protein
MMRSEVVREQFHSHPVEPEITGRRRLRGFGVGIGLLATTLAGCSPDAVGFDRVQDDHIISILDSTAEIETTVRELPEACQDLVRNNLAIDPLGEDMQLIFQSEECADVDTGNMVATQSSVVRAQRVFERVSDDLMSNAILNLSNSSGIVNVELYSSVLEAGMAAERAMSELPGSCADLIRGTYYDLAVNSEAYTLATDNCSSVSPDKTSSLTNAFSEVRAAAGDYSKHRVGRYNRNILFFGISAVFIGAPALATAILRPR